ncbi:hypothetical protein N7533_001028 [Penicillium manginii]|uniref:uncharacterized protein n=1 Tax=Penicillium manginii TaxID=203109 RepID=UPI002548CE42|nr:uncharacterized protein N7533_001028 [Penicillium manginii]KAJ5768445.1 hypothetical protein N7533_001028 [Penicillium manginii]
MAPKYALSDSESEPEADTPNVPSDATLEQALRDEVTCRWESGRQEEITVKRVRLAVEEELKLEGGFFRTTGDWKAKSEEIIRDQVVRLLQLSSGLYHLDCDDELICGMATQHQQEEAGEDEAPEPAKPESPPRLKKSAPKRPKSDTAPQPRKRQKTETPASEEDEGDEEPVLSGDNSEEDVPEPKKRTTAPVKKTKAKPAKEASPEASDPPDEELKSTETNEEVTKDDSGSEMSVVFDEEPKPAPKRQKTTGAPKEKKKAAPKAKDDDADPDQAEIKRLQGWLVKCGIRKMWWRMLEDAGMKGRYSLDKARQIRDERELKADLEQIQQGAKDWGKTSGDEGEGGEGEVPQRRAARGRQALAFLESDGEETD